MNHEISLLLELLDQGEWGLRFGLTVQNRSAARLFMPFPKVHHLQFLNRTTREVAAWYLSILVEMKKVGFALRPDESRLIEWRVRPYDVDPPEEDEYSDFDYYRLCVKLSPGIYTAWFQWRIDSDFYDGGSLMDFSDLECLARQEGALVWQGEARSNELRIQRNFRRS
jgi:hypothetical protein